MLALSLGELLGAQPSLARKNSVRSQPGIFTYDGPPVTPSPQPTTSLTQPLVTGAPPRGFASEDAVAPYQNVSTNQDPTRMPRMLENFRRRVNEANAIKPGPAYLAIQSQVANLQRKYQNRTLFSAGGGIDTNTTASNVLLGL